MELIAQNLEEIIQALLFLDGVSLTSTKLKVCDINVGYHPSIHETPTKQETVLRRGKKFCFWSIEILFRVRACGFHLILDLFFYQNRYLELVGKIHI